MSYKPSLTSDFNAKVSNLSVKSGGGNPMAARKCCAETWSGVARRYFPVGLFP